jgi:hypothetical protein
MARRLSIIPVLVPVRDGSSDLAPPCAGFFLFHGDTDAIFRTPAEVFGDDLTGLHSLHGCCHNRFASGVYHARHGLEPFEFDAKRQASPGRRRTGSVGGRRHHRWREPALPRLRPRVRGGVDGAYLGDRPLGPARRTVLCIDPARLTPHPSAVHPPAYSSRRHRHGAARRACSIAAVERRAAKMFRFSGTSPSTPYQKVSRI